MPTQTSTFICEIEVHTTDADRACLNKRLDAARQTYNACLGEARRRARLMFDCDHYKKAKLLPQCIKDAATGKNKPNPERTALFKQARKDYDFADYALQVYATQVSHSWLGEHLDANTMQKIATRAYRAVNDFVVGKRGAPRFKSKNRMNSVEGKNISAGIRFKENTIHWSGLILPLLIDTSDPVHTH